MKYDVVVFGGGTAGISAAYIAAKYKHNTLLVEKTDVLGGAITQGLVMPSMLLDTNNINTEFFTDLKQYADKYNARHTYIDGNEAWFNTELLKIVFDNMLNDVKCTTLFNSMPIDVSYDNNNGSFTLKIEHNLLSIYIETKYIVDATANGKIFKILNCEFQNNSEEKQAPTLRFMISGINIDKFSTWLEEKDTDRNVTTIDRTGSQVLLSTACTWDKSKHWALQPIFNEALENNDLLQSDTAYFQVFSVPNMDGTLNFNAPRIILDDDESLLDPFEYSRAVMLGRESIYRLYNFCKKYFPGFENSYISHISDTLGVRESYRVKCKYTVTVDDIINPKTFENPAFSCDYPIDIHSNKVQNDRLEFVKQRCTIPIEALISKDYDNLYAAGRIISADFEAQSALRTQMSCFSMGEAAAKDIIKRSYL